jgi:hypothetical protein
LANVMNRRKHETKCHTMSIRNGKRKYRKSLMRTPMLMQTKLIVWVLIRECDWQYMALLFISDVVNDIGEEIDKQLELWSGPNARRVSLNLIC